MWQISMQEIGHNKSFGIHGFKQLTMGMIMLKIPSIMMCHKQKLLLVMKCVCSFMNAKLDSWIDINLIPFGLTYNETNDTYQRRLCI